MRLSDTKFIVQVWDDVEEFWSDWLHTDGETEAQTYLRGKPVTGVPTIPPDKERRLVQVLTTVHADAGSYMAANGMDFPEAPFNPNDL